MNGMEFVSYLFCLFLMEMLLLQNVVVFTQSPRNKNTKTVRKFGKFQKLFKLKRSWPPFTNLAFGEEDRAISIV